MKIDKILIQNFRNISNLQIDCDPKINIIYGPNAQGKSNYLEAIGCLGIGKSFRISNEKALLKEGQPSLYLKGFINSNKGNISAEMGYDGQKKKVKINGLVKNRLIEFIGNLRVVYFIPEDLSLVKEGNSERRRYLDTMLCQLSHKYCVNLATYLKIIEQRNKILKERSSKINNILDALDIQLISYASEIWITRKKAMDRLSELVPNFFKEVTYSELDLEMKYSPCIPVEINSWEKNNIENLMLESLKRNRQNDIQKGYTNIGPHRDNIPIYLNKKDSKIFASQGQQRLISVSLKIAEMKYMEEMSGDSPILLLDDIFSELDDNHVSNLLKILNTEDRQVFITTAHMPNIEYNNSSIWNMNNGILQKNN